MLALVGAALPAITELPAQATPSQPSTAVKPAAATPSELIGTWRVIRGTAAPWIAGKNQHPDTSTWIGKSVRFDARRVIGPEVLNCANARYEKTSVPAEGMFQGNLSKSAKNDAMLVGVSKFPIAGVSLTCDTGIFEFHFPDRYSALLAMSDGIWTLDRSPGAKAEATSPSGVVQRFLETHFANDMGFTKAQSVRKARFMTAGLSALMAKHFAATSNPSEAPDINGDPFTNSQEYPTRFSVDDAKITANTSTVAVRMSDAGRVQTITYHLQREGGVWRIDDLQFASGPTLRKQLAAGVPKGK